MQPTKNDLSWVSTIRFEFWLRHFSTKAQSPLICCFAAYYVIYYFLKTRHFPRFFKIVNLRTLHTVRLSLTRKAVAVSQLCREEIECQQQISEILARSNIGTWQAEIIYSLPKRGCRSQNGSNPASYAPYVQKGKIVQKKVTYCIYRGGLVTGHWLLAIGQWL